MDSSRSYASAVTLNAGNAQAASRANVGTRERIASKRRGHDGAVASMTRMTPPPLDTGEIASPHAAAAKPASPRDRRQKGDGITRRFVRFFIENVWRSEAVQGAPNRGDMDRFRADRVLVRA